MDLVDLGLAAVPRTAADLAVPCPAVTPEHSCAQVLAHFDAHPEQETLPVVENGQPVGLIVRTAFVERFSRRFHHELFDRKSCTLFMDSDPLIVDRDEALLEMGARAALAMRKALQDGFIVTVRGRYFGTGTAQSLLRALADIQAARTRKIMESVRYASRIQRALLHTSNEHLSRWLPEHELHWEPRDVVGGDYYFCRGDADRVLIVVLDCTGHGVPGALMTMIMTSSLDAAAAEVVTLDPAAVLACVNRRVRHALGQHCPRTENVTLDAPAPDSANDGMDAAALLLDRRAGKLQFSGARLPLFMRYADRPGWICLPGGRLGVGYVDTPENAQWPLHEQPLQPGLRIAIATDGVFDQIGERRAIAYGRRRFAEALAASDGSTLTQQRDAVLEDFRRWQGNQSRRDDATLVMFEVDGCTASDSQPIANVSAA